MRPIVNTAPLKAKVRRRRVRPAAAARDGSAVPTPGAAREPELLPHLIQPATRTFPVGRWLSRFGWLFTSGAATSLAFAYVLPQHLWSENTPYLAMCAAAFLVRLFQVHLGTAVIAVAIAATAGKRWKLCFSSLGIGLIALGPAIWSFVPNPQRAGSAASDGAAPTLRVMSFNVNADNRDPVPVDAAVAAADPDVVAIQEFTDFHRQFLRPTLEKRYPHVHVSNVNAGVGVYSKTPLRISEAPQFADLDGVSRTRCEIDLDGRPLALYVVHLRRPTSLETFRQSRVELARLMAYVKGDRLPVLVAGDFNFTRLTPNATVMSAHGLRSAHAISGASGAAVTRRIDAPVLRHVLGFDIDHVFVGRDFTSSHFAVGSGIGSDHLPIIVDIRWKQQHHGDILPPQHTGGHD